MMERELLTPVVGRPLTITVVPAASRVAPAYMATHRVGLYGSAHVHSCGLVLLEA